MFCLRSHHICVMLFDIIRCRMMWLVRINNNKIEHAGQGKATQGKVNEARQGIDVQGFRARQGKEGRARQGKSGQGARQGNAGKGNARQVRSRQGKAGKGNARQGRARQGVAM
jgi:hypothetical protein